MIVGERVGSVQFAPTICPPPQKKVEEFLRNFGILGVDLQFCHGESSPPTANSKRRLLLVVPDPMSGNEKVFQPSIFRVRTVSFREGNKTGLMQICSQIRM